jgi:hypothetical protein
MKAALAAALCAASAWAAGPPVRVLVVTGGHSYQPSFYTLFEGHAEIDATVDPHPMPYRRGDLRPRYDVLLLSRITARPGGRPRSATRRATRGFNSR